MDAKSRMERHEQAVQITIPSCEIVPANALLLKKPITPWVKRFGLYLNKRRESAQKWEKKARNTNRIYEFKTLLKPDIDRLIARLEEDGVEYEVI